MIKSFNSRTMLLAGAFSALSATSAFSQKAAAPVSPQEPAPAIHAPRLPDQQPPIRVEVIDGITVRDIETAQVYRLYGVESCTPTQYATYSRQRWACGTVAIAWLINATLNKWLICNPIRNDGDIIIARCASGEHPDLSAAILKAGGGVVPPDPQDRLIGSYLQAEMEARKAYRGIWGSAFMMPWDWRKQEAVPAVEPPAKSPPAVKSKE